MATYATLNPSDKNANVTLSNGNLTATYSGATQYILVRSTQGKSSGKWYWEYKITTGTADSVSGVELSTSTLNNYCGYDSGGYGCYDANGNKFNNASSSAYGSAWTSSDTIGIALDMDNGKVWWSKNGTWFNSGDPAAGTNAAFTGLSGTYYFALCLSANTTSQTVNFGATALTYTPPSGFNAGLYIADVNPDLVTNNNNLVAQLIIY